jgi:hypothetical protein
MCRAGKVDDRASHRRAAENPPLSHAGLNRSSGRLLKLSQLRRIPRLLRIATFISVAIANFRDVRGDGNDEALLQNTPYSGPTTPASIGPLHHCQCVGISL